MDSHCTTARPRLLLNRRAKTSRSLFAAVMALSGSISFTASCFVCTAKAATIRDDTPDSLYTALSANPQYASASGIFFVNTGSLNSPAVGCGTLIAPDWVLTAAHLVTHSTGSFAPYAASSITFGQGATQTFPAGDTAQSVSIEPGWVYQAQEGNDLALVQLSTPVTTAVPAALYTSGLGSELTQTATIIGYGTTGNGLTGNVQPYGTRRAIQNVVDAYGGQTTTNGNGQQVPFTGFSSNLLLTDFDQPGNPGASLMGSTAPLPLEGASVTGDSGGGLFLTVNATTYLAAVTSFVGNPGTGLYGTYNGYTRIGITQSTNFITTTLAVPCTWQSAAGGSWATNANWMNGAAPQFAGATADFAANGAASQTVTLDDSAYPWIVGTLIFNSSASYTVAAGSSGSSIELLAGAVGGQATIDMLSGTHSISAPLILASNTVITITNGPDELHLAGPVSGPGSITLNGSGTLSLESPNTYSGTTTLNNGSLIATVPGALPSGNALTIGAIASVVLAANSGGQTLSTLAINSGGSLDIGNNHLFIVSARDPRTTILKNLVTGSNDGLWNGPGIFSSTAAGNRSYGVAYADGADQIDPNLTSGQFEVAYALYGDILLQGNVNGSDFAIVAANFGKSVTGGWEQGDFNYDGSVNGTDFSLLASNFGKSSSGADIFLPASAWSALEAFAQDHGLENDLPEPNSLLLAAIGLTFRARRRRLPSTS